jgi:multiple sugar transport system permease protein
MPHPEGQKSSSEINSVMLGLFAGIKDPDVERASFEYLAFLDSDEANRVRCKTYVQFGCAKFVNPALLKRFGYTRYLRDVNGGWADVFNDVIVHGKPEPYGENADRIYTELSKPIEQSLNDSIVLAALDRGDEKAAKVRLKEILDSAQRRTAVILYGQLPPNVRRTRTNLAVIFLVCALVGFCVSLMYLIRRFKQEAPPQTPGQKGVFFAYLLLFPAVISIFVWQYLPLIRGTMIAFEQYNVMGRTHYVGVANFSTVLFDASFWHSVSVTLVYTFIYLALGFVAPIVLALLLTEVPRGTTFFRTIFYLPAVLAGLVTVFLWKSFYKPVGPLNLLLRYLGIHLDVNWLDSPSLAMIAVLLPLIWAGTGPGSLIYLAALKTIPEEFHEAADLDGAGICKKITCITLPGLKMLILINLIGAVIGAFLSSETILAMTGGGPYTPFGATEVVGLQLFYTAFMYLKFGVANAMAWILGFMLLGFTLMQLRNLSRVQFKGGR